MMFIINYTVHLITVIWFIISCCWFSVWSGVSKWIRRFTRTPVGKDK